MILSRRLSHTAGKAARAIHGSSRTLKPPSEDHIREREEPFTDWTRFTTPNEKIQSSNWSTFHTQVLSKHSLLDLFHNKLPDVRVPAFLSAFECKKLVEVIKQHQIGSYNKNVYPPIGAVGVTQFDNRRDMGAYFGKVNEAYSLQRRFQKEAQIDVVGRVQQRLHEATGMPVRIASENKQIYFAGLIRLIDKSALLHADYGPFDGPSWEIGKISAQATWNILLKDVPGGESIVYDRFWQGAADDATFKDPPPGYGYSHRVVDNCASKMMKYTAGDLHLFNPRNFHEVKSLPTGTHGSRFTMTSFIGLLPHTAPGGPALILWS